ncbi:hypothetical protein D6783_00845 [Candidatus Woesearchaeota archaeon]|nr:MAG: hypothetical protein D6783_00845 [Candidatus Woesearchaeota archaeon]
MTRRSPPKVKTFFKQAANALFSGVPMAFWKDGSQYFFGKKNVLHLPPIKYLPSFLIVKTDKEGLNPLLPDTSRLTKKRLYCVGSIVKPRTQVRPDVIPKKMPYILFLLHFFLFFLTALGPSN